MNAVLKDQFFYANLHGLLAADMQTFAARANRKVSDELCFVLSALLCTEFCARAFTLASCVPAHMLAAVPSDPRVCLAASKAIHAQMRPMLAARLSQCTNRAHSPEQCLAWLSSAC